MSTRVLLVDDQPIFLQGLRALLDEQPDIEVLGEVMDGQAAVRAATEEQPDVVLMDLTLPIMNGMEATREITARAPGVKVVCLSIHAEHHFVDSALGAGAMGYLVKDCVLGDLLQAIRTVAADRVYLSPSIAHHVLAGYEAERSERADSAFSILTPREREVLQLLAEGCSTKEIAARLFVSAKTVGTHREHIMEKLDVHSVAGLTKYAIREGLTSSTY